MSIVDNELAKHGMTIDQWECDPDFVADLLNLAVELEAHCDALADAREPIAPRVAREAYAKFKKDRG